MLTFVILFLSAFLAAAISGIAGFGGALLLLPLLTHAVGPVWAVPLLTVAQLMGNLARVGFGVRVIRWRAVGVFLLGAIPLSIMGALSFLALPKTLIVRLIGLVILLFVGLQSTKRFRLKAGTPLLVIGGGCVGFLSGLVGSAGPLGAATFLALDLPALAYISSEATTALVMHAVKLAVYQQHLHFTPRFWALALLLGIAMLLGTWVGKRLIERMPPAVFRRIVTALLVMIAVQMLLWP